MREWGVKLGGVYLSGGSDHSLAGACEPLEPRGCLPEAPDGLGLPALRTEDVTYPQRDGVTHFSDWYEPRIITLAGVTVCPSDCTSPLGVRQAVQDITSAWARQCQDSELVIYTPWHNELGPQSLKGPFGVVGRPRVASIVWGPPGTSCATLLLRFDAVDHRLYLLDGCGTPGSGTVCATVEPGAAATKCRAYPRCTPPPGDTWCYGQNSGGGGGTTPVLINTGTICAYPTITLNPTLTDPILTNLTTGQQIRYTGTITDAPVVIDTATGTATQAGASRTHLLTGSTRMTLEQGPNTLQLTSYGFDDDGSAQVCFRPAVVQA